MVRWEFVEFFELNFFNKNATLDLHEQQQFGFSLLLKYWTPIWLMSPMEGSVC